MVAALLEAVFFKPAHRSIDMNQAEAIDLKAGEVRLVDELAQGVFSDAGEDGKLAERDHRRIILPHGRGGRLTVGYVRDHLGDDLRTCVLRVRCFLHETASLC